MKTSLLFLILAVNLFGTVLPENAPFPGGMIVQEIESKVHPDVYFGKRQLMVLPSEEKDRYFIVAGISLNQKVKTPYKVTIKEGKEKQYHSFILEDKAYKKQYITMKNKRKVSPLQKDMTRINDESSR